MGKARKRKRKGRVKRREREKGIERGGGGETNEGKP